MLQDSVYKISSSVLGYQWRRRCNEEQEREAKILLQQNPDLLPSFASILASRGAKVDLLEDFLQPRLKRLMPNPSTLQDCDQAASLLKKAILEKHQIGIITDYDVDGATSGALLINYLRFFGLDPLFHVPDRLKEGYGPSVDAIETLYEQGCTLLITLDCGTLSYAPLEFARHKGMKIIVIDHHLAHEELPAHDALVNPNRRDDLSNLTYLAACGVTFMVLVALNRILRMADPSLSLPDLMRSLDLVALGTIADLVPLQALNRAFIIKGLMVASQMGNKGFKALFHQARLSGQVSVYDCGFGLGPRINAGGRIGEASLGLRLLISQDYTEAETIALRLEMLNQERQEIEKNALEEAYAHLPSFPEEESALIALGDDWHPGITGLVASRLKERYNKACFALTRYQKGLIVGSARSIPSVNIGEIIQKLVRQELCLKGGGHAMAGGLTLLPEKLDEALVALQKLVKEAQEGGVHRPQYLIDNMLSAQSVTDDFMQGLLKLGPYGQGYEEPLFAFPYHFVSFAKVVGQNHIRFTIKNDYGSQLQAIAFRARGTAIEPFLLNQDKRSKMHFLGHLSYNEWAGRKTAQLRLVDLAEVS